MATVLTPEDLAVAKYALDGESPTRLDVAFHAAPRHGDTGDRTSRGTLTGQEAITFSGRCVLEYRPSDRETTRPVDLEIVPRGAVFDLAVHAGGGITARGMGIRDPGADGSLLVSWWTGDRRPAGIVKYTISPDRQDTVRAVYTSIMLEAQGFDDVLGVRRTATRRGDSPASTRSSTRVWTEPGSAPTPGRSSSGARCSTSAGSRTGTTPSGIRIQRSARPRLDHRDLLGQLPLTGPSTGRSRLSARTLLGSVR